MTLRPDAVVDYQDDQVAVIRHDARGQPLEDETVDLVCTSPPYFALRSYRDDGEHYAGQIGSEDTPDLFLDALDECMVEWGRVLKPSGSVWINLGDKYANDAKWGGASNAKQADSDEPQDVGYRQRLNTGMRPKTLMGLPWRFAIRQIDNGWILRAEVVWDKPYCLSGGTVVYARTKGRIRAIKIHDLCRAYQPDDVQLWNGERWTQVLWWEPTGRSEGGQLEVEFRNGERVGCTPEHRWPLLGGSVVPANSLIVGDVIAAATLPDGDQHPARLDEEIGWFVGLYLAEGSRSGTTIQIASHAEELDRFKRLQQLAASFGENCAAHSTGGLSMTINLTGRFLDAILASYIGGKDAYTKHLRPLTWTRPNWFLNAIMQGYLDGDGHDSGAGRWQIGFTGRNDDLASNLRTVAARIGGSLRLRRRHATGFGQEWPIWSGSFYFNASRRKQPDTQIVAIRKSRARQFWDIGVEDDPHLFALASGVLTHNSLPESVTDRVRRSHEQWFHMVKEPRYFAGVDEIREPQKYPDHGQIGKPITNAYERATEGEGNLRRGYQDERQLHPLGRLPGSVWTIPSEPLLIPDETRQALDLPDHFAAFPQEWPRRIITGWSPTGICTKCGEGRRPVVTIEHEDSGPPRRHNRQAKIGGVDRDDAMNRQGWNSDEPYPHLKESATITAYVCACPTPDAHTTPSLICDPFGGTGTVAGVAKTLGRYGISNDLSESYNRLAIWRITQSGHFTKTEQRSWADRQGSLL